VRRLGCWLIELLVALDQLAHVLFGGPKFLLFGGPCPSADETISSKVGRQAMKGKRWAIIAERGIDALFSVLGQSGHCRANIEWDEFQGRPVAAEEGRGG
jgi:hypothetical protein